MRNIVVGAFVSLDGVMQAPGGPEEDPTGGFRHGGWTVPLWDDVIGAAMGETLSVPFDLLLGRKTYDIFAAHWPYVQADSKVAEQSRARHGRRRDGPRAQEAGRADPPYAGVQRAGASDLDAQPG